MSKHACGSPSGRTPKQQEADARWKKYVLTKQAGHPLTHGLLRDAVLADIRSLIEECVDEPARKDLHQGRPGLDEPIGSASIASLMELYGETGVSEDQWKSLVLRLARTLMQAPVTALKRMTWDQLKEWVRVSPAGGMANRWASDLVATPGVQLRYEHVRMAFDAGQKWAEVDRCPDCSGRSHSQEECPAHDSTP